MMTSGETKQMEDNKKYGEIISDITVPEADVQANYNALQKTLDVMHNNERCVIRIKKDSEGVHFAVQFIGNWQPFVR
jgi:hypothetical protein